MNKGAAQRTFPVRQESKETMQERPPDHLDLRTLATTDACGASSRFPAQEYDLREAAPAATAWRRATRT